MEDRGRVRGLVGLIVVRVLEGIRVYIKGIIEIFKNKTIFRMGLKACFFYEKIVKR